MQAIEMRVGDFVVVEWPLDGGGTKKFVFQLYKIGNSRIRGSFLRPMQMRNHPGLVYGYPAIWDWAIIPFERIVQLLKKPRLDLRSLFVFSNLNLS